MSDAPILHKPVPELADHPLFAGKTTVGLMSGDNPLFPEGATGSGHAQLGQHLASMGLQAEDTRGSYGAPEKSYIIHAPTREQMYGLGKAFGQESVVFSSGGHHELLYTNGPHDGKFHPSFPQYSFHAKEPFPDYYTVLPGRGYLRLYFDQDRLETAPLKPAQPAPALAQPARPPSRGDIAKALAKALTAALARSGK